MPLDMIDDRRVTVPEYSPVCTFCIHRLDYRKCAAFDEIPLEIWEGKNDHTEPFEDDRGIQFERRPKP